MKRLAAFLVCLVLCLSVLTGAMGEIRLSKEHPVVLTVWHYYNGMQQQVFDRLVEQFNDTVGKEQGIIIESFSQGSVNNLYDRLMASVRGDVGASNMPDICAAYADTVYEVSQMGMVADLAAYMPQEEMDEYISAYMLEGELNDKGSLKLFPIAKSTEMLLVNKTVWDQLAAETGVTVEQLSTWEGITEVSRIYWQWTDAMTETPHDGKAFFGRDAFANYMIIGSLQLGKELFCAQDGEVVLQVDRDVMRRLWDNYAVPYINGWFAAYGRFRSDDVKTGQLAALVGSTSGALYFPDRVTTDDGTSYPIESMLLALPGFEGTEPYAVQQGAGMFVRAATPEREYAATIFLKWFTQEENNINFSMNSGYLPVKRAANNLAAIEAVADQTGVSDLLRDIIAMGVQITGSYQLYTNNAFEHGNAVRAVAENSMPAWMNRAVAERDRLVNEGMRWEDAVASLTGDEAFDAWYTDFCEELQAALADQ